MRGFQGDDLADARSLAATAKHFCAYGAATAGLEYASAEVSERTLREVYLPPFEAAVGGGLRRHHAGLQRPRRRPDDRARAAAARLAARRAGFEGVIVSDYNAIAELHAPWRRGRPRRGGGAGVEGGRRHRHGERRLSRGLPTALERGLVDIADIDAGVRCGFCRSSSGSACSTTLSARDAGSRRRRAAGARRQLAREAARRAIVLLTNRRRAAARRRPSPHRRGRPVGRRARPRCGAHGRRAASPMIAVTILEGLRAALPECEIVFRQGRLDRRRGHGGIPRRSMPAATPRSCCALAKRRR